MLVLFLGEWGVQCVENMCVGCVFVCVHVGVYESVEICAVCVRERVYMFTLSV